MFYRSFQLAKNVYVHPSLASFMLSACTKMQYAARKRHSQNFKMAWELSALRGWLVQAFTTQHSLLCGEDL